MTPSRQIAVKDDRPSATRAEVRGRNASFDYLRVTMCVLVLIWHEKTLGPSGLARAHVAAIPSLAEIFYFNVALVAVPTFLAMSGWLTAEKMGTQFYLWTRVRRFAAIFFFWSAAYSLIFRISPICDPSTIRCYAGKVLTGNGAFHTYYLLVLIIQDSLLALLARATPRRAALVCAALIAIFGATSLCGLLGRAPTLSAFYSPLSFVALPAAIYIARGHAQRFATMPVVLLLSSTAVLAACAEWWVYSQGGAVSAFPAYARPSVVLGAMALVAVSERFSLEGGPLLKHLAGVTLGVYLVHPFLIGAMAQANWRLPEPAMTLLILAMSYAIVGLLKPVLRERLI